MSKLSTPLKGFESKYSITPNGQVFNTATGREIKAHVDDGGYLRVTLSLGKVRTKARIHRLLALQFIPNPYGYELVRHLDDDKLNNDLSNLSWGTPKDNMRDALDNGKNFWQGKTECKYGHKYMPENTYYRTSNKTGVRVRYCAECQRIKVRDYKARKRLELANIAQ